MIDRLREQIQERLHQVAGEAERLRKALAALDPRPSSTPASKPPASRRTAAATPGNTPAKSVSTRPARATTAAPEAPAAGEATTRRARATTAESKPFTRKRTTRRGRAQAAKPAPKAPANGATVPATSEAATESPRRTAPGATRTAVLAALAGGEVMTAAQVAEKTGVARPTVSTTLSRLAKSGEVQKAERGYRLPSAETTSPSSPEA